METLPLFDGDYLVLPLYSTSPLTKGDRGGKRVLPRKGEMETLSLIPSSLRVGKILFYTYGSVVYQLLNQPLANFTMSHMGRKTLKARNKTMPNIPTSITGSSSVVRFLIV